jgi:hypothetical protein
MVSVLSWVTALNIIRVFLHTTYVRTAGRTIHTATSLVTFKPKPQPETWQSVPVAHEFQGTGDVITGNHVHFPSRQYVHMDVLYLYT